jgi:hypothetical protein
MLSPKASGNTYPKPLVINTFRTSEITKKKQIQSNRYKEIDTKQNS